MAAAGEGQEQQQPSVSPVERHPSMALEVESSDTPAKPEDYVIVNGFRMVKPYHFDFGCNIRQRWIGENIIDIFTREFPARDRAYYLQALADGRLRVEGCQVTPTTPLRDGHRMRHFIHRHEPPVPRGAIAVVGQSPDVVAVCKPAGMPVHVTGQYRKNTVLGVLTAERPDLGPLFPMHRLDKPVSGLLLFARSAEAAAAECRRIESRQVEKVYVARVLGRFPASEQPIVADVPLDYHPFSNHASAVTGAALAAEEPAVAGLQQAKQQDQQQQAQQPDGQHADGKLSMTEQRRQRKQLKSAAKKGVKAARQAAAAAAAAAAPRSSVKGAKPALTEFRLLAVAADGLTSVVECRPRTGRTHQIRVHLQYLGHPIANDTQYGGTFAGPLTSRHMAQQLGVHWAANRLVADGGAAADATPGPASAAEQAAVGMEAAQAAEAGAGVAGVAMAGEAAAAVAPGCIKRPRLVDGGGSNSDGAAPAADPGPLPVGSAASAAATAVGDKHNGTYQAARTAAAAAAAAGQEALVAAAAAAAEPGDSLLDEVYVQNRAFRTQPEFEVPAPVRDHLCVHCPYFAPRDYPLDLRPLWLHALTYSCTDGAWSFSTQLPDWAHPEWTPAGGPQGS